jgi:hypothetical protein
MAQHNPATACPHYPPNNPVQGQPYRCRGCGARITTNVGGTQVHASYPGIAGRPGTRAALLTSGECATTGGIPDVGA